MGRRYSGRFLGSWSRVEEVAGGGYGRTSAADTRGWGKIFSVFACRRTEAVGGRRERFQSFTSGCSRIRAKIEFVFKISTIVNFLNTPTYAYILPHLLQSLGG